MYIWETCKKGEKTLLLKNICYFRCPEVAVRICNATQALWKFKEVRRDCLKSTQKTWRTHVKELLLTKIEGPQLAMSLKKKLLQRWYCERFSSRSFCIKVFFITWILSGAFLNVNKIYTNITYRNIWKKCIWLIINWHQLEDQDTAETYCCLLFDRFWTE